VARVVVHQQVPSEGLWPSNGPQAGARSAVNSVAATARDTRTLEDLAAAHTAERLLAARSCDVTDTAGIGGVGTKRPRALRPAWTWSVPMRGYRPVSARSRELTEQEARRQNRDQPVRTHWWVTKAVVPLLREQRSGHIIQVSSIGGVDGVPHAGSLPRVQVGP